ncbi:hypothetical protein ACHAXT_011927 [Thalassiosira profunda]
MAPPTAAGLSALAALAAASPAAAFQSISGWTHHRSPNEPSPTALMARPFPPGPGGGYPPFLDPFGPWGFPPGPVSPFFSPRQSPRGRERHRPHRYVALDVDAEVIADEADEFFAQMREEEEWTPDSQKARKRMGEVINFDPEQPASKPLKNAAAAPGDMYEDENKFTGRRPGQAVNRQDNEAAAVDEEGEGRDPREQHVILDDFENDLFQRPVPPRPPMGGPRRPGPSVYTQEEEELIAAMGGRGRPSTQEFAGLGTMLKKDGRPGDPQRRNYNPEQDFLPPPPDMMPGMGMREEGYLGDSTLREISHDFSVPIPYLADVLASWGAPVPIDPMARLGDMVTGEQAFAVLEAIHTLDVASLHERYSEDNLISICEYYDIDLKEAFEFCVARGWALPFGVRTFLRVEQEEEMLDALGGDDVF